MTFVATHTVGGGGAATWAAPDPNAENGPRLDPWLPVMVLRYHGDWAEVRCENGWEAWTDGRSLLANANPTPAPVPVPVPAPVVQPAYPQPAYAQPGAPGASFEQPAGSRPYQQPRPPAGGQAWATPRNLAAGGAVVAVVGSLLPWLSGGGVSLNAWDEIFFSALLTDDVATSGIRAGHVVLLAALGLLVLWDVGPWWVLGIAGLAAVTPALLLLMRLVQHDATSSLSFGPFVTIAGGVALFTAAFQLSRTPGG